MFQKFVNEYLNWWNQASVFQRWGPLGLTILYWSTLQALGGFRGDHVALAGASALLWYLGPWLRKIFWFAFPFLLTGIVYDSQRFYSDYIRGPIRVEEPYLFDLKFFGIPTENGILTPNEWWQLNLHPVLDVITGFAYLVFVLVYIIVSAYFYFYLPRKGTQKVSADFIREQAPRIVWTFFWVNLIGYSTYYWYAAAPPWYVELYGFGPARLDTPANPAGCIRFDQILGTNFFGEMYGRSADVFGAIPSLHVAYPYLSVIFAFRFGSLRAFNVFFYVLMCFAAVYLNHHYILDLIWGTAYSILTVFLVDQYYAYQEKRKLGVGTQSAGLGEVSAGAADLKAVGLKVNEAPKESRVEQSGQYRDL